MKKLLVVVLAVLAALPAAEIAYRVALRLSGEPYDAGATRARLAAVLGALDADLLPRPGAAPPAASDGVYTLHPYHGWEVKAGAERIARDADAYARGLPDEPYVVVVLGGSVAGLFTEPETGASDVLKAELEADPRFAGRKVLVVGQGRGAFKQPQQLFLIQWLFQLGITPHAVINLDGLNEVAVTNENAAQGIHPLFPSCRQWIALLRLNLTAAPPALLAETFAGRGRIERAARAALDRGYSRSAVLGRLTLARIDRETERWYAAQRAVLDAAANDPVVRRSYGPPYDPSAEAVVALGVESWEQSSRDIEALCRRRGIRYLHVLQPTLHDQGSKPWTESERKTSAFAPEWIVGVDLGYDAMRARGARMRAEGFPFHDASMVFEHDERTLYYDGCHFIREGNVVLAQSIARAFLELPDLP